MPNWVTYLDRILYLSDMQFGCGSKNIYQNGIMCLKEVGLCAQNITTILGILRETYMTIQ